MTSFFPFGSSIPFGANLSLGGHPVDLDQALHLLRLCPRHVCVEAAVNVLETRAPASVLMDVARSALLSREGAVFLLMALSRGRCLPGVREELLRRHPGAESGVLAVEVMAS